LKFGLTLPAGGEWHYPFMERKLNFAEIRRMLEVGEEEGFESVWVCDHVVCPTGSSFDPKMRRKENFSRDCLEAWTTLSAFSTITNKMTLCNWVLCNLFRHPPMLAKMASTLDVISNGRLALVMGAGWFKEECEQYGIPYFPYGERMEMFRESIKIIKTLWTEKVANFEGKYYSVTDAYLEPKPIQKPHPPIWVGGSSVSMMNIVAEDCDGWDVGGTPDGLRMKVEELGKVCGKYGRSRNDITISHSTPVLKAEDYETAVKLLKPAGDLNKMNVEDYPAGWLLGTERDIVDQVEAFSKAGTDLLIVVLESDQVDWFNEAIIPSFV